MGYKGGGWKGDPVRYGVNTPSCLNDGLCIGDFELLLPVLDGGSVLNRLNRPVTAWETVIGILQDEERECGDGVVLLDREGVWWAD